MFCYVKLWLQASVMEPLGRLRIWYRQSITASFVEIGDHGWNLGGVLRLECLASISYLIQILARLTNPQNQEKKKKKYTSSRFLCLVGKNEANASQEAVWSMRIPAIQSFLNSGSYKNGVDVQYQSCTLAGEESQSPEDQTFDRAEPCQNSLPARWSQNHTWYLWFLVMGLSLLPWHIAGFWWYLEASNQIILKLESWYNNLI